MVLLGFFFFANLIKCVRGAATLRTYLVFFFANLIKCERGAVSLRTDLVFFFANLIKCEREAAALRTDLLFFLRERWSYPYICLKNIEFFSEPRERFAYVPHRQGSSRP